MSEPQGVAERVRDNALRRLREHPDLDELRHAAGDLAYLVGDYKRGALRTMLLEAFGAIDDRHPQRAAAELAIKRAFREAERAIEKAGANRAREVAREARRLDMLEYEQDRDWARHEAKRLESGDDDATALEVYVDIATVLEGDLAASAPDAGGIRSDGERMLYRGKVNGLVGEPEAGKTLTAIAMAADELSRGGSVLHIDVDHNGPADLVSRYLAALDATTLDPRDVLTDPSRFRLVAPETTAGILAAIRDASDWRPSLAIIDSVGEVVPMFGGDSRSEDDYTRVNRDVFSALAEAGAAVLTLDHVAKTALSSGYATGTGAKKRAMNGAYYSVKVIDRFAPGQGGAAALTILKDRPGGVRAKTASDTAAVFRLDARDGSWSWDFHPGRSDDERSADGLEQDVATVLALEPFPASRTALQGALRAISGKGWNNERARIALAEATQRRMTTFPLDPRTTDR